MVPEAAGRREGRIYGSKARINGIGWPIRGSLARSQHFLSGRGEGHALKRSLEDEFQVRLAPAQRMLLAWQLFWGFFKVGILGYGGGPGSLSLIQAIAVDSYHWLDTSQFGEMLAIGNALPGPIATKMAATIGWRIAGPTGAAAALIGVVLPSLVLMLGGYQLLLTWRQNPYVEGLIRGVKPIVLVLLVGLVLDFAPSALPRTRLLWPLLAFFVVGFVLMRVAKVPAVWVILASMAGGALLLRG